MLVEAGFVRAVDGEGKEWTFTPSLRHIADLGKPHEIVAVYAGLHGPKAAQEAAYVLACLCDQEDPLALIGHHEERFGHAVWIPGPMPAADQIVIARHLMEHGIVGKARPGKKTAGGGKFSDRFDASEYISAARVHLQLSSADAESLSMTEFQQMFAMKFPDEASRRDVPDKDAYFEAMTRIKERRGGTEGR